LLASVAASSSARFAASAPAASPCTSISWISRLAALLLDRGELLGGLGHILQRAVQLGE
jgi:hypothetical protein